MLFIGLLFIAGQGFVPQLGRNHVLIAGVVPDGTSRIVDTHLNLSLSSPQGLRNSLLDAFLLGFKFGIAAEQNVSAAAGHVGGNRDHALTACLGDDLGFLLVILGIEDDVLDALFLQQVGQALGFLN